VLWSKSSVVSRREYTYQKCLKTVFRNQKALNHLCPFSQQFGQKLSMVVQCREAIEINLMWSMNYNFCKFSGFRTSRTCPFQHTRIFSPRKVSVVVGSEVEDLGLFIIQKV